MGIFNIDWLSFTVDFENYDAQKNWTLNKLFQHLDEQRERQDGQGFIDLGLFSFEVYPHGSRSYYYILHNEDLQIKLARYRSGNKESYPVFVHMKSYLLWADIHNLKKVEDKFGVIIEWLVDLIGSDYKQSKINRLDLCYHTDDVPEDFSADCFVGRHTVDRTYRTHRVVSGVEIGSRKTQRLFMRAYNKYLEVRSSDKTWFFDFWFEHKLNFRKVWNIEFQMNREFFDETKINGKRYNAVEEVLTGIPAIWNYLVNDWVTYRIPSSDRRTRWEIHPWWLTLKRFEEGGKIKRGKQKELPTEEAITPALNGYITSYAARKGLSLDDGTLFKEIFGSLENYYKKTDTSFEQIVEKKKKLLGDDESHQEPHTPIS